jgi:hypothetical protein
LTFSARKEASGYIYPSCIAREIIAGKASTVSMQYLITLLSNSMRKTYFFFFFFRIKRVDRNMQGAFYSSLVSLKWPKSCLYFPSTS